MTGYSFLKTVRALSVGVLGAVGIVVGSGSAIAQNQATQSQIVTDGTSGSFVVPFSDDDTSDAILGGIEANGNLLHNFQDFNVGEGRSVYFVSPSESIRTIFSNVTGNSASNILGTLGTLGNSVPDLWLINPNGILFGPNSRLNLGGAFFATTANEIQLEGVGTISASKVAAERDILTINNSAFLFNRDNSSARIINQSQSPVFFSPGIPLSDFDDYAGLEVARGETIGLISRDISFQGGGLHTLYGNVILQAVEDIELTHGAAVQAGSVSIDTSRLSVLEGSQILTQFTDPRISEFISYADEVGTAFFGITPDESFQTLVPVEIGDISVSARESVTISGASAEEQYSSRIGTGTVGALRTGGNISLTTDRLNVADGGQISSNYISVSDSNEGGGSINIDAPLVEISGSFLAPESANSEIAERLSAIQTGSSIVTPSNGSVEIESEAFRLLDGARIIVNLTERNFSENTPFFPGGIDINSTSAIISGVSESNHSSALTAQNASSSEKTTPLTVTADALIIQEGAGVSGQDIKLDISETVLIEDNSGIFTTEENSSDSEVNSLHSIAIEAQAIRLQDNAFIRGSQTDLLASGSVEIKDNASVGQGGENVFGRSRNEVIRIEAENIRLQDDVRVSGSEIELSALNSIAVEGRTQISTDNGSLFTPRNELERVALSARKITVGNDVSIVSPEIELTGGTATLRDQATVSANQQRYGSSGAISINVDRLDILDSAQLSASIGRPGGGGSINIEANDVVNVIGDRNSDQPAAIRATADGPGTGGRISIRTGGLSLRNGSQIVASLNGGGTGGSVTIEAEDFVSVSGGSTSERPSGIFADSNLENGEFVVLRSTRENDPSPQFISMLLNTEVLLFTQAPSLIQSRPRTGNTGSNQIFINYNPPSSDPRSAENLRPQEEDRIINRYEAVDSVGNIEQIAITENSTPPNFSDSEVSTNQSILIDSTTFLSQQVGTARQTLFNHFNVPDSGVLITGQSMSTDFDESIQGGVRVFPTNEELAVLRANFIESLESIKNVELVELENIETNPDEFSGVRREGISNDLDAINSAFSSDAGELYVIESTGEEFRIRDDRYTDTRFTNIQPGDRFLVFAVRDGGDISIETSSLNVSNGAEISATSLGAATGNSASSNLNIIADTVTVENNASISSISETGTGGNISIRTPNFTLNNSAVTAEARANASGGNIDIGLPGSLNIGEITASNGSISSSSDQATGGNVSLRARSIQLQGDSDIETSVSAGTGDGGNITLSADYIIAFDDSDLFAFSGNEEDRGEGGDITLNTPAFFGEAFSVASLRARPDALQGNDRVDINATGSVDGAVSVPDVSFVENTLVDLPDSLIASEQLIASSCIARSADGRGTLVETGRDGIYVSPESVSAPSFSTGTVQSTATQATDRTIEEPHEVYQLADGRLFMGKPCL